MLRIVEGYLFSDVSTHPNGLIFKRKLPEDYMTIIGAKRYTEKWVNCHQTTLRNVSGKRR